MIYLLKLLFLGHVHRWKILKEGRLTIVGSGGKETGEHGSRYVMQCERCGWVKQIDIV